MENAPRSAGLGRQASMRWLFCLHLFADLQTRGKRTLSVLCLGLSDLHDRSLIQDIYRSISTL